jgi:hypothetical protein
MKLIYLNDTQKPQFLFLHSLHTLLKELAPAESITLDILIAEDQAIFVKTWGERVLIGRTDLPKED